MQYGDIVGGGGRKGRRPSAVGAGSRGQLLYQVQQSILDRSTEAPLQVRETCLGSRLNEDCGFTRVDALVSSNSENRCICNYGTSVQGVLQP